MHHLFRIVAFVGLTCVAVTPPAAADPISITSGFIVVTGPFEAGSISIAGTRGFSVEGGVDPAEGRVDPIDVCGGTGCLPGTTISVGALIGSPGVSGTATLDGNQYKLTGSEDPATLLLELIGAIILPQLVNSPTLVTAPFSTTQGSFFAFDPFTGGAVVPLNGSGIATLSLFPAFLPDEPPLWVVDQVRYDFNAVPTPVPEPSAMTLITLGLAATTLRARMRRRANKA